MTQGPALMPGFRIGVAGASSLLGQEILRVLKDRSFPVVRLSKFEAAAEETDLPVLDLSGEDVADEWEPEDGGGRLDVLFLAARGRSKAGEPDLLGKALAAAGWSQGSSSPASCPVIDVANALQEIPGKTLVIPSAGTTSIPPSSTTLGPIYVSPHPATIALARILLRLAERFSIEDCMAQVFLPASELGPRGIEELQKQTVNLLSFQKVPQKVFGAQLAFNLLARLPGKPTGDTAPAEVSVRRELREFLAGRIPAPALHFCHAPVFYSLAFSIFVELKDRPSREAMATALTGNGMSVRSRSEAAPNPVESAGSGEIAMDAISSDPDRPGGYWLWATVDNIRLAAENAVDVARWSLLPHQRTQ